MTKEDLIEDQSPNLEQTVEVDEVEDQSPNLEQTVEEDMIEKQSPNLKQTVGDVEEDIIEDLTRYKVNKISEEK